MVDKSTVMVPKAPSFEEALQISEALVERMADGSLPEAEAQRAIAELMSSSNGARGFFVVYLSEPRSLPAFTQAVLAALKTAPDVVSSLLVKNLAMSTAMAVTHRRNQNEEQALGSDQVRERSLHLIQQLQTSELQKEVIALAQSIDGTADSYQTFLQQWGYDQEQQQAIRQALAQTHLLK
ncbi:hypothetical protein OsccyDRAFT_3377 [Leptolyngbyaceae cyanobacterium JSC-12]|nr:hypothetical protein OsccyDRAFT_3377 [Leptolyngbyaceae cyanobacterium JSC-12]